MFFWFHSQIVKKKKKVDVLIHLFNPALHGSHEHTGWV
jgi:hypothetical protein